ncbi:MULTISPECIES: hypothetical protein [Pseudomonas]|uniref:hypothetical protein n=1 Tax=Pseudomonas TaxID=286 RepID=UPI0023D7CA42|nr:hypothetical protein [Pseudomonas sp. 273]
MLKQMLLLSNGLRMLDVGCGGFGVAAVACQIYRAAGGANPISGAVPSTGEQVLWGATAILNGLGIYGTVADGVVVSSGRPKTEKYFRVEGGGSGVASSQNRITVNADGSIRINPGCSGQLCVSVGNSDHATYFLSNKRPDGTVVVFEVDAELHNQIMSSAIPQRPVPGIPRDPSAPKIVDPNQPGVALELPKVWEAVLEKHSSNARVYSHDEFLREFGN